MTESSATTSKVKVMGGPNNRIQKESKLRKEGRKGRTHHINKADEDGEKLHCWSEALSCKVSDRDGLGELLLNLNATEGNDEDRQPYKIAECSAASDLKGMHSIVI